MIIVADILFISIYMIIVSDILFISSWFVYAIVNKFRKAVVMFVFRQ